MSESRTHCVPPVTYIGTSILLWTPKACVVRWLYPTYLSRWFVRDILSGQADVSESRTHSVPPVTYIGTSILLWTPKACVVRCLSLTYLSRWFVRDVLSGQADGV